MTTEYGTIPQVAHTLAEHSDGDDRLISALTEFFAGASGAYRAIHWLSPPMQANPVVDSMIGLGLSINELDGTISESGLAEGQWRFIATGGAGNRVAIGSGLILDPTGDYTLISRVVVPSAADQEFFFGMGNGSDPLDDDKIGIRVIDTGNFFAFTDDGSTETTRDSGVAPSNTERLLQINIRDAATVVSMFLDGTQIGADITTNIPTASNFQITMSIAMTGAGNRPIYPLSLVGWRES